MGPAQLLARPSGTIIPRRPLTSDPSSNIQLNIGKFQSGPKCKPKWAPPGPANGLTGGRTANLQASAHSRIESPFAQAEVAPGRSSKRPQKLSGCLRRVAKERMQDFL